MQMISLSGRKSGGNCEGIPRTRCDQAQSGSPALAGHPYSFAAIWCRLLYRMNENRDMEQERTRLLHDLAVFDDFDDFIDHCGTDAH
jgi:hypothetical protein